MHLYTAALLLLAVGVQALNNGLGLTPQMGYSSWMDTSSDVTEDHIKYIADLLVKTGLSDLGYQYVNVDAGWLKGRWPNGTMMYDDVKFPSGMKALGDYIHSLGLKYGLYTCRGTCQCSTSTYSGPGSYGYEVQDANTMVSYGMDYLKEDSCCASQDHPTAFSDYGKMRDALNATGRPVFFSLCGWESWYAPVGDTLGNSWRIAGDGDNYPALSNCINTIAQVWNYSGPGGWNDPDLLLGTGQGSYGPDRGGWYQTDLQSRTQFSAWCIFPAPLLISADIGNVSSYAMETWSNAEAIAVHQDMGKYPDFPHAAWRFAGDDLQASSGTNVWGRALSDGSFAMLFINNNPDNTTITCDQTCFAQTKLASGTKLVARDLWLHQDVATINATSWSVPVAGNGGCSFFKLTPSS